ncbi:hypothetical protein Tco_0973571 [Tanacetum coccineum]
MIGESPYTKTKTLNFVIVRSDSPHNLLIGRIGMQKMGIVVSRIHVTVKFHTPYGIGTVSSTYESNKVEKWQKKVKETISEATKDVLSCLDAKERIIINDRYPKQTVFIRKTIKVGRKLFNTENKMNEYKHIKPVKQKMRGLGLDHNEATCKEVDELTKAGIIQKVKDQTWVANLVMVKKSNGGWRILKNAGATYQRLVDKVFNDQIRKKLKAYVDDMVIKSTFEESPFLRHLITRQGIRANPSKVKVVTDLEPPRTLKDVQSLNEKLAALSRFL